MATVRSEPSYQRRRRELTTFQPRVVSRLLTGTGDAGGSKSPKRIPMENLSDDEVGVHITWTVEFFVPGVGAITAYEKMKDLKLIPPEGVMVGSKKATCKVLTMKQAKKLKIPIQPPVESRQTETQSSDTSPSRPVPDSVG